MSGASPLELGDDGIYALVSLRLRLTGSNDLWSCHVGEKNERAVLGRFPFDKAPSHLCLVHALEILT